MRHLSLPTALPGEALSSLLSRYAAVNDIPARRIFGLHAASCLLTARRLTTTAQEQIAAELHLDPSTWDALQFSEAQDAVVGDLRVGAATQDPLGWALTHHHTLCPRCHEARAPWFLKQQLGLAWTCSKHRIPLLAACGVCDPRPRLVGGAPLRCTHFKVRPEFMINDETMALEAQLQDYVQDVHPSKQQWLRDLRAVATFAYLDAALMARSPHLSHRVVDYASAAYNSRTRRGGRLGMRLDRPPHDPWVNAELTTAAIKHLGPTGVVDYDWLNAVAGDVRQSAIPVHRLRPFSDHLDVHVPGTKNVGDVSPGWLDLALEGSELLRSHNLTAAGIPAALIDPVHEDLWTLDWPPVLARSVLLHSQLTGDSLTGAVRTLGHHFTAVTAVKRVVGRPPSRNERVRLLDAVQRLSRVQPVDFAASRGRQRHVTSIPTSVLSQLGLRVPHSGAVSPGQVAAAWLWCVSTGSLLVSVPFVDGRALRPLAAAIRTWHREQSDTLVGLLDWNNSKQDLDEISTPSRNVRHVEAV